MCYTTFLTHFLEIFFFNIAKLPLGGSKNAFARMSTHHDAHVCILMYMRGATQRLWH